MSIDRTKLEASLVEQFNELIQLFQEYVDDGENGLVDHEEDIVFDRQTLEGSKQIQPLVERLLEQVDLERLAAIEALTEEDWVLLAIYWIAYVNQWTDSPAATVILPMMEDKLEEKMDSLREDDAYLKSLDAALPRFMRDGRPLTDDKFLRFKALHAPIRWMLDGIEIYPWSRDYLTAQAQSLVVWSDEGPAYENFFREEQGKDTISDVYDSLSVLGIQKNPDYIMKHDLESWADFYGFYELSDALRQEELSEDPAHLYSEKQYQAQVAAEAAEPSSEELAAIEENEEVDITAAIEAALADPSSLIREEDDDAFQLSHPILDHDLLIEGQIPETLEALLKLYGYENMLDIAAHLELFDYEHLEEDELLETLLEELPRALERELLLMGERDFEFFSSLLYKSGQLVSEISILSLQSFWNAGYFAVSLGRHGYRMALVKETRAVIEAWQQSGKERERQLTLLITECCTALVHITGVVKFEEVIQVITTLYADDFADFNYKDLRRFIREQLELLTENDDLAFVYDRPYLYHRFTMNLEEAQLLYSAYDFENRRPEIHSRQDIKLALYPPFSDDEDAWNALEDWLRSYVKGMDDQRFDAMLYELLFMAMLDVDLVEVTDILERNGIEIKVGKAHSTFLGLWSDVANHAPAWRFRGQSPVEAGAAVSFVDRMQRTMQNRFPDYAGGHTDEHHDHDHHHHHHDHDHGDGHHHH